MTALENVAYGPSCLGHGKQQARAIAMDLLDRFGIQLSGGMRQRVGLARALAVDPPCILLDEPLSAADRIARSALISDLQRYLSDGGRIVLVTHELADVTLLGDAAIILRAPGVAAQVTRFGDTAAWMRQLVSATADPPISAATQGVHRLPTFAKMSP
jgi:ABC-type nitrate/sulfonate/bicarbonate transport system ATPase subunit